MNYDSSLPAGKAGIKRRFAVFLFLYLFPTAYFLLPTTAYAVCPICTVAVGAGLGLSRYFGIDDAVSSIWIGGIFLSSSFWLSDWLDKKNEEEKIIPPIQI